MKRRLILALTLLMLAGCQRSRPPVSTGATAFGASIAAVSQETQVGRVGALLDRPLAVQVNDADGNGIAGARVEFTAIGGASVIPASGITGEDGQIATRVRLGDVSGRYSLVATTRDRAGKPLQAHFTTIALDYRQALGRELSEKHCARCHDERSTAERVSNHDNLRAPPHSFFDGTTLNKLPQSELLAIVAHGGAAVGRSLEMPPYAATLSASDIAAVLAYIRAIAGPT